MPFMPAVSLTNGVERYRRGVAFRFFLLSFFFSVFAACSAGSIFWLSTTSAVRTRASVVLGLSFYPLEQAPNMVIYAMSKSATATSGLIYIAGVGDHPSPGTNARRCCQKIHLRNPSGGWKFRVLCPSSLELFFFLCGRCASLSPVFQGWFARWINAINRWLNAVRLDDEAFFGSFAFDEAGR